MLLEIKPLQFFNPLEKKYFFLLPFIPILIAIIDFHKQLKGYSNPIHDEKLAVTVLYLMEQNKLKMGQKLFIIIKHI